jgi:hypothetical protein
METDVTRAGDCCQPERLWKCMTCKETDVIVAVTAVSPTSCGSVSHAWKIMLPSQATAVSPTSCGSVSHAWKLMLPAQVTAVTA